jgi:hypothetical protein
MLTPTALTPVQRGLDSSIDPVREVVVQVACPVSHLAVAGYFEETHYSVLRPIKSPTASPRSTDFSQQLFKRRSANLAALQTTRSGTNRPYLSE